MRENNFLKRLRDELPLWVERDLIKAEQQKAILNYVAEKVSVARYPISAFSMLGVLLLATGVITFFAANWEAMAKLTKLAILFGAMWGAYGSAYYFTHLKNSPKLGQALLLLGALLFGANIMLIAQIYHIDEHYPNGVLMWALGGLLVAYLLNSQSAMLAAIALATLWSGMEIFDFAHKLHWPFLLFWGVAILVSHKRGWQAALHLALLSFLLWSFFTHLELVSHLDTRLPGATPFLMQIYFLFYLGMMVLGMALVTYGKLQAFGKLVQRYAAMAALLCFYVLTFPDLHDGASAKRPALAFWIITTVVALLAVIAFALWHRQRVAQQAAPAYLQWGRALLLALLVLLLANLFIPEQLAGPLAIFFNVFFFAGLVWLIYAGMAQQDRFLVNAAFVFFAVGIVTRYFDTFWTLLNRSFFFMVGGILLLGGGYLLEKQRRKLTEQILAQRGEGERS